MRITQGCFSFLPDLTDDQISIRIQYCLEKGWAVKFWSSPTIRIPATHTGRCGAYRCSTCMMRRAC